MKLTVSNERAEEIQKKAKEIFKILMSFENYADSLVCLKAVQQDHEKVLSGFTGGTVAAITPPVELMTKILETIGNMNKSKK